MKEEFDQMKLESEKTINEMKEFILRMCSYSQDPERLTEACRLKFFVHRDVVDGVMSGLFESNLIDFDHQLRIYTCRIGKRF